jgi:hypothetical protein
LVRKQTQRYSDQKTFLHPHSCALSCPMQPPRIRFRPVELKARHDGWTAARQNRFIEVLAATRSINKACSAVGMSRASAYKLRDRADARQFRLAWNAALRPSFDESRRGGAPKLTIHRQPTSSALQTLQTCLTELRAQEQELGSPR